ncbi:hypothetical protein O0L34_g11988 [Tuta absoluta]|nr:hypothetical protein O0L34_g11988 [Tuta absoluta]
MINRPIIEWTVPENDSDQEENTEYGKHRCNIREVLLCSNATPIRSGGLSYNCSFCLEKYSNPQDLRQHNLDSHGDDVRVTFMQKASKTEFLVKLDITDLECKLCGISIDKLDDLLKHLKYDHDKKIHLDIGNQIMPFKLPDDKLTCAICQEDFRSFKRLQMHMHTHYRNYVCGCSAGFINLASYNAHLETHKEAMAEFKIQCSLCPKSFPTEHRLSNHMKYVHTKRKHHCSFCDEIFDSYKTRSIHLSEVHGVKMLQLQCQICGKSFKTSGAHNVHVRRNHLMERNRHCQLCDMKFFDLKELEEHMVTHTGSRDFQCDICHKRYGRKKALIEHMRIHLNDRRFECIFCGLKFVQKCSLKGHLSSKHGELFVD